MNITITPPDCPFCGLSMQRKPTYGGIPSSVYHHCGALIISVPDGLVIVRCDVDKG